MGQNRSVSITFVVTIGVTSRLFGKAAQCLLSPRADASFYPEHIHDPLRRRMLPVLHFGRPPR
jgi:hypothetical protein